MKAILPTICLAILLSLGERSAFAAPPGRPGQAKAPVKVPPKAPPKAPTKVRAAQQPQARKPFVRAAEPSQPMKGAPGWTRMVRATDASAGAYFAETLALIVDSQYVVVPWTFISEVWLGRPGARLLVEGAQRDAVLADVDLVSNLALLKLAETIVPTFYRTEIRLEAPDQNEPLQVLASRDWVRGGARFLRTKSDGLFVRYQIAYGAGDLASVRYIFDKYGRLVAVSSGNGGDDSWSAPARAVYELIRRQSGPKPASVSVGDQRRAQLYYWQERWAKTIVPARSALTFQGLDCQTHLASISDRELAAQVKSVKTLDCGEKFSLPVVGGYSAGMRVSTGEAVLRSSDAGLSSRLAEALAGDAFGEFDRMSAMVNLLTVPECRDTGVVNRQGLNVHVKFCTAGLKFEPGLADTAIVVSAVDGANHANYSIARLKGFDQKNTKMVLESLVENVRGHK